MFIRVRDEIALWINQESLRKNRDALREVLKMEEDFEHLLKGQKEGVIDE